MTVDEAVLENRPIRRKVWKALWPIRHYIRNSRVHFGKGFLAHRVFEPMMSIAPEQIRVKLPDGSTLVTTYGQVLTREILLTGDFEPEERKTLASLIRPGTTAIDVGANIGIFTTAMANAAEQNVKVVAIEPIPQNVDALRSNIALNNLTNVHIFQLAASDREYEVAIRIADDLAYNSIHVLPSHVNETGTINVHTTTLDSIWETMGRPDISAIKIDVEQGEVEVVKGAISLIEKFKPVLLVELQTHEQRRLMESCLEAYGYRIDQPIGFMPWNYLCQAETLATN